MDTRNYVFVAKNGLLWKNFPLIAAATMDSGLGVKLVAAMQHIIDIFTKSREIGFVSNVISPNL